MTSSASAGAEPLGEEAERSVTRICDSILGRLNGNEAPENDTEAQRWRRRTLMTQTAGRDLEENPDTGRTRQNLVQEETRQWILEHLREVMQIAMHQVTSTKTLAADRIKWSRIAIAAGQACNAVLRDVEIDALKQQINELKQLTLSRVSEDKDSEADEDQRD
jgi:hypothetical protein